jgi:hypothetical protein
VCDSQKDFICWPSEAILLWHGCNRVPPEGKTQAWHEYPLALKQAVASMKGPWDPRPNGPAIKAFLIAGGNRPPRKGTNNAWSIHHVYSGKFPHSATQPTTHAKKEGLHFTQSAGLVAVHPIADALCDEFPFFSWFLRARAFQLFGYDPDHVFHFGEHDEFGFIKGSQSRVIYCPQPD